MGAIAVQPPNPIFAGIEYVSFLIIAVFLAWFVLWLVKKNKLSKLKKEEKDIYYKSVGKIKKIALTNRIVWVIGIVLFIIVAMIKINLFPTEYVDDFFGLRRLDPVIEFINVAPKYIIIYYIVHILFSKFYINKRINKHEELSENEKTLLKKYYINPIFAYVFSAITVVIASVFCIMLFTPIG